ncbi:MAG: UDP-N-acetylmuramate dehydrogenase [Clostridiales bacterium]|nr:UDP-N-acetylmuramate dehydrogenase [Clostridiales bacterium]
MNGLFFKEKYARYNVEIPFEFARHASIGCGGRACVGIYPRTIEELLTLVQSLEKDALPYCVVGNMTNVLPCEGEIEKVIVNTSKMLWEEQSGILPVGVSSVKLLRYCEEKELGGAEFLEGIPCTLGGALYMNAGVSGKYVAELVDTVFVYREGKTHELVQKDCGYAYKQSVFMDGKTLILGAKLALVKSSVERIKEERQRYRKRRAHLPKGKSMGCVFKNPTLQSAGSLIDGAGLKGLRVGGAKVSETHANFILNDNGATSQDIRTLIETIKRAVFAKYKIRLEEEIRYLT